MKAKVIKVSVPWVPVLVVGVSFLFIVPYLCLFPKPPAVYGEYDWSTALMAEHLPRPESAYGEITCNDAEYMGLCVSKTTLSQYEEYVDACKGLGFNIEAETTAENFSAYDGRGYKLLAWYYEDIGEMHIGLMPPIELGVLVWPESGLSLMLPKPEATVGSVTQNDGAAFCAYVGETSVEEYRAYVEECKGLGFNVDIDEADMSYYCSNGAGYQFSVCYEGNKVICISLYAPK